MKLICRCIYLYMYGDQACTANNLYGFILHYCFVLHISLYTSLEQNHMCLFQYTVPFSTRLIPRQKVNYITLPTSMIIQMLYKKLNDLLLFYKNSLKRLVQPTVCNFLFHQYLQLNSRQQPSWYRAVVQGCSTKPLFYALYALLNPK